MMICGTFGSEKRSCLNCNNFMLWGVSYGYCSEHKEDMPAQHKCSKYRKIKFALAFKEISLNGKQYYIERFIDKKKTIFVVECYSTTSEVNGTHFYSLRDAINAIKKDAFK